jgi:uncharacterized protein YheU (UPF0270 family)
MLENETLINLVESYVSQVEGSDFDETPFQDRVEKAVSLVKSGEIVILFSEEFQTPFLLTKNDCINRFGSVPKEIAC